MSLGAPPPALSATSANTTGLLPGAAASARSIASSIVSCVGLVSLRILKISSPSSLASASALPMSPSVITTILAPTSATSPHGKPCPNDTLSTPSRPSSAFIFATKLFIGSTGVRHMLTIRQS